MDEIYIVESKVKKVDLPDGCVMTRNLDSNTLLSFTHRGELQDWQLISLVMARHYNPKACIVILSDNGTLRDHPVARYLHVSVEHIQDDSDPVARLSQNYRHSSSNDPDFEVSIPRFICVKNLRRNRYQHFPFRLRCCVVLQSS
eukprot:jgi/Picsp_1/6817/NSC_04156-R1_---NA---